MNSQTTHTGEAVNITAGFIGTTSTDPRAGDLVAHWVDSIADAFGTRPTLEGDLSAEDRARLLIWLDEHGRDALLRVALDPTTRITTDGGAVVDHGEPIHAAGATASVLTVHEGDHYSQHVVLDAGDEPLTAAEAREVAAALLATADQIDGRETELVITPGRPADEHHAHPRPRHAHRRRHDPAPRRPAQPRRPRRDHRRRRPHGGRHRPPPRARRRHRPRPRDPARHRNVRRMR